MKRYISMSLRLHRSRTANKAVNWTQFLLAALTTTPPVTAGVGGPLYVTRLYRQKRSD